MDVLFNSFLGPVTQSDLTSSLLLMLKGMVGIFVVMMLIFVVIVLLSKIPRDSTPKSTNKDQSNRQF